MDRQKLAAAWESLGASPFPSHPQGDDLADWVLNLAEADGFYAGIAATILGGDKSDAHPTGGELDELEMRLDSLEGMPTNDVGVLEQCRAYLTALKRLHDVIVS